MTNTNISVSRATPYPREVESMGKKHRGMSMAVTAGLLITVAIAFVVALWYYNSQYAQATDFITAQATLITSRYINNNPVYVVDIAVSSKVDTRLYVDKIDVIYTMSNGDSGTATIELGGTTSTTITGYTVKVTPNEKVPVDPGSTAHITLTFTGTGTTAQPIVEMSFRLTLVDDAGNTYSVTTNSVSTG